MKINSIFLYALIIITAIFIFSACTANDNNVGNTNMTENTGLNDYLVDTNGVRNGTGLTDLDGIPETVNLPGERNILPPFRYINIK